MFLTIEILDTKGISRFHTEIFSLCYPEGTEATPESIKCLNINKLYPLLSVNALIQFDYLQSIADANLVKSKAQVEARHIIEVADRIKQNLLCRQLKSLDELDQALTELQIVVKPGLIDFHTYQETYEYELRAAFCSVLEVK